MSVRPNLFGYQALSGTSGLALVRSTDAVSSANGLDAATTVLSLRGFAWKRPTYSPIKKVPNLDRSPLA